jgi:hypothetical protein
MALDVASKAVSRASCGGIDVTGRGVEGGGSQGFRETVLVVAAAGHHPMIRAGAGVVAKMEGMAMA